MKNARSCWLKIFVGLIHLSLFCSAVLGTFAARAEVIGAIGKQLSFETESNGRSTDTRQPLALRAGYRAPWLDMYFEYASFRVSQGTSLVQVNRLHQEWTLWARRMIFPQWRISPYGALGVGLQNDRVETNFETQSQVSTGQAEALVAAVVGARAMIHKNAEIELEAKLSASSNYSPNPLIGLGFLIGFQY